MQKMSGLSPASQNGGPQHECLLETFVRMSPAQIWRHSAPDECLLETFNVESLQATAGFTETVSKCHSIPLSQEGDVA